MKICHWHRDLRAQLSFPSLAKWDAWVDAWRRSHRYEEFSGVICSISFQFRCQSLTYVQWVDEESSCLPANCGPSKTKAWFWSQCFPSLNSLVRSLKIFVPTVGSSKRREDGQNWIKAIYNRRTGWMWIIKSGIFSWDPSGTFTLVSTRTPLYLWTFRRFRALGFSWTCFSCDVLRILRSWSI